MLRKSAGYASCGVAGTMPLPRLCRELHHLPFLMDLNVFCWRHSPSFCCHARSMIKKGFIFPSTIERMRQGPLSKHIDAYSAAQVEQGYGHQSIR